MSCCCILELALFELLSLMEVLHMVCLAFIRWVFSLSLAIIVVSYIQIGFV